MFLTKSYDLMALLGGSLIDCLDHSLEPETVLKLMYQASQAVKHMHLQNVPITHLDIKVNIITYFFKTFKHLYGFRSMQVENFLIGADGLLKLCDFGSSTIEIFQPTETWSAQQRNNLEEHVRIYQQNANLGRYTIIVSFSLAGNHNNAYVSSS